MSWVRTELEDEDKQLSHGQLADKYEICFSTAAIAAKRGYFMQQSPEYKAKQRAQLHEWHKTQGHYVNPLKTNPRAEYDSRIVPALVRSDSQPKPDLACVEDLSAYNPGLRMIWVLGRLAVLDEESERHLAKFDGQEGATEINVDLTLPIKSLEATVAQFTMAHLHAVLQRCGGNKMKAARLLGMSYLKLYRMMERVEVKERH